MRRSFVRLADSASRVTSSVDAFMAGQVPENVIRSVVGMAMTLHGGDAATLSGGILDRCKLLYRSLGAVQRTRFLSIMGTEFGVRRDQLRTAATAWLANVSADDERKLKALRDAATPLYAQLFSTMAAQADGLRFLIDMRADLLGAIRAQPNDASLRALDASLRAQLQHWFAAGFLELRQITWESPAALLEKVVGYEVVHPMAALEDVRQRLVGPNRRCYGFFHALLPDEPLVFIEVALTDTISDSVQAILTEQPPSPPSFFEAPKPQRRPQTAIFYSINSTQQGLSGIDLGAFLIKRVVADIQRELPHVGVFSTLSPIPGYCSWLRQRIAHERAGTRTGTPVLFDHELNGKSPADALDKLEALIGQRDWHRDAMAASWLRGPLLRNCAYYLTVERKRSQCVDPVGNFHLRNGAIVWRLNWQGDVSARGMAQSAGIMVNYLYPLHELETNHLAYVVDGDIRHSPAVADLLSAPPAQ